MNSGIYKVWNTLFGPKGKHKALIGRLMVYGNELHHLEDHTGAMQELFPEGQLNDIHQRSFQKCQSNPYVSVEKEEMDLEASLG